jgi:L-asparaginase II
MKICQRKDCQSNRIVACSGKTSDLFACQIQNKEHEGYVPNDLGIGGGDYIGFSFCLEC